MKNIGAKSVTFLAFFLIGFDLFSYSTNETEEQLIKKVEEELGDLLMTNKIPGFSLVIIKGDKQVIKNYGLSDIANNLPVTSNTLFELGSCSKAFTALALLKLVDEGVVDLDSYVSEYIPWFEVNYKSQRINITVRQVIHHTSGIPSYTLSLIPQSDKKDALEQTVRIVNGIDLKHPPGKEFEYATVGYDILAFIIQQVTGIPFEEYMQTYILESLELSNTTVGSPIDDSQMSKGHKIGFFKPREYQPPPFRGNNAAGYVISNAEDMAKWLKYQLGLKNTHLNSLILKSHERDESVEPSDLYSYAYGWQVSLKGNHEISHGGMNPNYTSHVSFRKRDGIGVAVLANSNSAYTEIIGQRVMGVIAGDELPDTLDLGRSMDTNFSIISIILIIFLLLVISYFGLIIYRIFTGKRIYRSLTFRKFGNLILSLIGFFPFLFAIYLLPKAIANFSWESAIVWGPISFYTTAVLCLISMALCYFVFFTAALFPDENKYLGDAPRIILLSVLSGLSNTAIIILITSFIDSEIDLILLLFYFVLSMILYLVGRKIVDTKVTRTTWDLVFNLKMQLTNRVFSTSYEKFEKIDSGRVYSTMNGDIETISILARMLVNMVMSFITALGAFIYLAVLAFWATLITIFFVIALSTIYYFVSQKTSVLFDEVRETHTVYMRLLNGMIDGFKEISLHRNKRFKYRDDLGGSISEHRVKTTNAQIAFVNAFLVGEFFFLGILGVISLIIPRVFDDIPSTTIISFVMILLYLIGPVNAILDTIPELQRIKIAWKRIQGLIQDIPANLDLEAVTKIRVSDKNTLESLSIQNISYKYDSTAGQSAFSIDPFSVKLKKGELLFIVGGNGSGKTTLAKILTGLYSLHHGDIFINNERVDSNIVGEYFSVVFNPFHLFKKLYQDTSNKSPEEIKKDLRILDLDEKVQINNNEYSTIDLSGGQRKRLALLQCYIEDKPIYLFDEWAADQDPTYRKLFYKELLPKMKEKGKIIIAITHDDNYFDVADKIVKLDMGKAKLVKDSKYNELLI